MLYVKKSPAAQHSIMAYSEPFIVMTWSFHPNRQPKYNSCASTRCLSVGQPITTTGTWRVLLANHDPRCMFTTRRETIRDEICAWWRSNCSTSSTKTIRNVHISPHSIALSVRWLNPHKLWCVCVQYGTLYIWYIAYMSTDTEWVYWYYGALRLIGVWNFNCGLIDCWSSIAQSLRDRCTVSDAIYLYYISVGMFAYADQCIRLQHVWEK